MATRKGNTRKIADTRPTLDEVKQQSGRNLFVTYEGTEGGAFGIPALRPRFAGDIPEELNIELWTPKMIADEWLDDVRFRAIYEQHLGIKVWKTDQFPKPPDLSLPDDLERDVTESAKQLARIVATTEYNEQMQDIIGMESHDVPISEAVKWETEKLYPFLEVVRLYEERMLNRPEVIRAVDKRLNDIDAKAESSNRRNRYKTHKTKRT